MDRETLRRVQLVQLEIAKEIKRICDENNIQYFLVGGTLLGAVRHQGFIPWDDDLDIGMLRDDYEKFVKISKAELNSNYSVVEWKEEIEYPHPMAKVIRNGTLYIEETRKDSAKQGIWVDIFAYDRVPKNVKQKKSQGRQIMIYRAMIRAKCHYETWHYHNHFIMKKWIKNLPFRFLSIFFKKETLVKKYEHAATQYNNMDCEFLFENGPEKYGDWNIPAICFDELIDFPFENELFKVPKEYDLYLKTAYGHYMTLPPESERENRHSILKVDFGDLV